MSRLKKVSLIVVGTIALSSIWVAGAQDVSGYESGPGALQVFDGDGMAATPLWVQVWIAIMLASFAAGLLFVWKQPIARWAVGGFIAPFVVGGPIYGALGWPFLSGAIALNHLIFWSPALFLLLTRRPFLSANHSTAFRIWSGVITFVIVFSFIFDVRDAVIYLGHVLP